MSVTIDISDEVTPMLDRVRGALENGEIEKVMARGALACVTEHLFELDEERPNQLGGRRTHFYARAAKATHAESEPGEVTVTISMLGIRQRYEGGPIAALAPRKYLTIPAVAEAYGKRAGEFNNLVIQFGRGGRPVALVEAPATQVSFGREKKGGTRTVTQGGRVGGRVMFWLVPEVHQDPDPTVLPSDSQLALAAVQAAEEYISGLGGRRA